MTATDRPVGNDYLLVGLYALVLFGFSMFSGRPLTMHEARLPECGREMLHRGDWLLPTSGGRPWLERPPLPHWVVICVMKITTVDDRVWVVRLPSAVMGTATVLLTLFVAGKWCGRTIGVASGLMLATSYTFYRYACLAEDDIYLAMLVAAAAAVFTKIETSPPKSQSRLSVFSMDRWSTALFAILGLTSWAKGPLLGLAVLGPPIAAFSVWRAVDSKSAAPVLRYVRLPAWVILIGLTVAWPWWAVRHYPDVVDNWKYDYVGRINGNYTDINQPWWYYGPTLLVALAPWTPLVLWALWRSFRSVVASTRSFRRREECPFGATAKRDELRFVLCWAVLPVVIFSIPHGKHEHYLVPFLAPWAILAAAGLVDLVRPFAPAARRISFAVAALLLVAFSAGQALFAAKTEHTIDDTKFLARVRTEVPADVPVYIDAKLGPPGNLDFFRIQFYSRADAVLVHNLSYLRDQRITAPAVYVIAREGDRLRLETLGRVDVVDQSVQSHEQYDDRARINWGKFTLFRLRFDPNLVRYPTPASMTNLQAMERADGPWCGPAMR